MNNEEAFLLPPEAVVVYFECQLLQNSKNSLSTFDFEVSNFFYTSASNWYIMGSFFPIRSELAIVPTI